MPELPEVETVRRTMERVLVGHTITEVEIPEDAILLQKRPASAFIEVLHGAKPAAIGRKGKTWWIDLGHDVVVYGHLGMTGWIRQMDAPTIRLKEHGKMPLDDENGRPRFLKMLLTSEMGDRIAFTDGRRLARMWLGPRPNLEPKILQLGFDCLSEIPSASELHAILQRRAAPLKAVLLDQSVFAGVGNWIADEVCFQAQIFPGRIAKSLSPSEVESLRTALQQIVRTAVDCGADENLYPKDWLFHARWGGNRGVETWLGMPIRRETIAGRTTAWIPELQK